MESAFSSSVIKSAFRDNGQINELNDVIPNEKALLGTYRGPINESHYLNDSKKIIKMFYKEMFMNGKISESSFDKEGVDQDRNSTGDIINRDFEISKENCQRAKVLLSQTQRDERVLLIKEIRKKEIEKQISLYETESKLYENNQLCEEKITHYYEVHKQKQNNNTTTPTSIETPRFTFIDITILLSKEHFGCDNYKGYSKLKPPTVEQLRAFFHVRQHITKYKGRSPVYTSLKKIKKNDLIDMCFSKRNDPVQKRQFKHVEKEPDKDMQTISD